MYEASEEFAKELEQRATQLKNEAERLKHFIQTANPEVIHIKQQHIIEEMLREIQARLHTCWKLAFSSPEIVKEQR
jgi:cob(I)alamin adenosyltransferase